jgi:hypothetical protein
VLAGVGWIAGSRERQARPCANTLVRELAERVGFEPTDGQAHHLISSQARSTGLRHLSAQRES